MKWIKSAKQFIPGHFKESNEELANLGCGWFHVYSFQATPLLDKKFVKDEVWLDEKCQEERLALVLIDIGSFQHRPFSQAALNHIKEILEFFCQNKKQMILRFAYDTKGKGSEHDPLSLSRIQEHMHQLAPVLKPYLQDIVVIQGIFVGSWGEMHDSKFLDAKSMSELIDTLYQITNGQCFLAVRTPAQWRAIAQSSKGKAKYLSKLGLFNDGIFGSPTDLSTYSVSEGQEKWTRPKELKWQESQVSHTLNGGEVLSCYPLKPALNATKDFSQMHVSYLNGIYHPVQLDYWKNEVINQPGCWQGVSGYDYIGRHLGYRFVVMKVQKVWSKNLQVSIQNTGFANLTLKAELFLEIESEEKKKEQLILVDPRDWESGKESIISIPLKNIQAGKLYLSLRYQGSILKFANQEGKERVFLGEFK